MLFGSRERSERRNAIQRLHFPGRNFHTDADHAIGWVLPEE